MTSDRCQYCQGAIDSLAMKCSNCGAPVTDAGGPPDYRYCPYCGRKLLALASPACSYCGQRLPEDYLEARGADLRRLREVQKGGESGSPDAEDPPSSKKTTGSLLDLITLF
jgi:DNA-directed RNA polymerase subunit RPC12/RpoP